MLGDLRVLDTGDELLLDYRARRAAGALQHDPPLQDRLRRGAAQAHARARPALAHRPGRARGRRRGRPARRGARQRAARRSTASPVLLVATDVGVDLICDGRAHRRAARGAAARGAAAVAEAAAEVLRVERGRPRYGDRPRRHVDPPGGRASTSARSSFTKGCYVGQETVARLYYSGQAQPPPARAAPLARRREPATSCASASARWAASAAPWSPPRSARSRWRSCAARPSRARRSRSATAARRRVVELPF